MNEAEHLVEARRWLRFAREDIEAAEALLAEQTHAARHPCWLAQQAAEKALKAALVFVEIDFPHRHDLDALRNLLPADWVVTRDFPDLAQLTEWAVEARYPGDWPEATDTDAQQAVQQARSLYDCVASDLAARGCVPD